MLSKNWSEITIGGLLGFVLMMASIRYVRAYLELSTIFIPCEGPGCYGSAGIFLLLAAVFYGGLYFLLKRHSQSLAFSYGMSLMLTLLLMVAIFFYLGLVLMAFNEHVGAILPEDSLLYRFWTFWILDY